MEIKTFKKLKDNRYKIIFDNEENIVLYDDIIVEYNLLVNKEIDDQKLKEILEKNSKKEAYYLALKLISTKMRTQKEITKYLERKEFNNETIEEVIKQLYKERYLSDERYIKAFMSDKVKLTDKGPLKIKDDLVKLGFREEVVRHYLMNYTDEIWSEKINKYIVKKRKTNEKMSATMLKHKIIHDLLEKGHYKDLVKEIIETYEFRNSEELLRKEYKKIRSKLEEKYEGPELNFYLKVKLIRKGYTSEEIERFGNEE